MSIQMTDPNISYKKMSTRFKVVRDFLTYGTIWNAM